MSEQPRRLPTLALLSNAPVLKTAMLLVALLVWTAADWTQAQASQRPVTIAPAIWKVERQTEAGVERGFLFGTMHLLPNIDWQTPAVSDAMARSDLFVFELETDQIDDLDAQALTRELGLLPKGVILPDLLGSARWTRVSAFARSLNLPAQSLTAMKPWLASLILSQVYFQSMGFEPAQGVEAVLLRQLRAQNRPTASLETMAEQFSFLNDLPQDVSIAMLLSTVQDIEDNPDLAQHMLQFWVGGDTEGLSRLLNEALKSYPEAYDTLLAARNRNWIPQIISLMGDGRVVFAAVGAGHLVGEDSVVDLLRAEGFTVTREQ